MDVKMPRRQSLSSVHIKVDVTTTYLHHARLSPEYQSRFDEKAAWEYAQTLLGLPYGYQNFIFGWIDTPSENYPWPLSSELLQVAFPVIEKVNPEWAIVYLDSFNLR